MDLKTFLKSMTPEARDDFARKAGTSVGHLINVSGGYSTIRPALCVSLERLSGKKVTRQELRDDYADIWPELVIKAKPAKSAQGR